MMRTRLLVGLAALLSAMPPLAAGAPGFYAVTPASGKYDQAVGLNNAGVFAVNNRDTNVPYRIGYLATSPVQESVGTLGGNQSDIRAFNDKNQAVGDSLTADGIRHAFLYSAGRISDLTTQYGIDTAQSINNQGDIAGQTADGRALRLQSGKLNVFGPAGSSASDINNLGAVAGDIIPRNQGPHAFRYEHGKLGDLGTLGGTDSDATAINDAGTVVGASATADGRRHAFIEQGSTMIDLTPAAGASVANDINTFGDVVGAVGDRAFLYTGGKMVDLTPLVDPKFGLLITSATAINDRGQILAQACTQVVFCYLTVRLDPVPAVPESPRPMMLLAGLALLAARRILKPQPRKMSKGSMRSTLRTPM
jgi:probable HAF family extracellular repeat protein